MNRHYYAILCLAMAATLVFAASAIGTMMAAAQNNSNNNNSSSSSSSSSSSNADSPSVVYMENMKYRDYKDGVFKLVDTGASV